MKRFLGSTDGLDEVGNCIEGSVVGNSELYEGLLVLESVGVVNDIVGQLFGIVQFGNIGCEHCLNDLLLHTAPGSQHVESSLHSFA